MENWIGELVKPAIVLIDKISNAIGGCFRPFQIKRVARAEAEADRIKAIAQIETQIEITDITRRAFGRFLIEETNKQNNMESITSKAIPLLLDDSRPEEVDNDWITNFFDKCRLVSDGEMQELWAKILAGEANSPGKYSKRTINFLGSLDKIDAIQFTALCGFSWIIGNKITPLIYKVDESIYKEHGIDFDALSHLDNIGLLNFITSLEEYKKLNIPKRIVVYYYGRKINIEFMEDKGNELLIGRILLSKTGEELARVCDSKPIPGFIDYVIKNWITDGLVLSSPYPR
jgi:hypothetical protein